jgi:hypothetical protein
MPNVFILSAKAPVTLDIARRFHHHGWHVWVGDNISCKLSSWSNCIKKKLPYASPRYQTKQFIKDLINIINTHQIDLVIPSCEDVFYLARYQHLLPKRAKLAVDHFNTLKTLHSKFEFQQLIKTLDKQYQSCALETKIVNSLEDATLWQQTHHLKGLVLKPEFSRFGVHTRIYPNGIPNHAPQLDKSMIWVAQAYQEGTELCSYSIAHQGKIFAHALYEGIYRLKKSASYYYQPKESLEIYNIVKSIVEILNFSGQIAFDWIINPSTQQIKVLECNPRATSGIHLFDITENIPDAFLGKSTDCIFQNHSLAKTVVPMMLGDAMIHAIKERKFIQWYKNFRQSNDVITQKGDIKPLFGGLCDLTSYAFSAKKIGCTVREFTTRDIEWDGDTLADINFNDSTKLASNQ